MCTTWPWKVTCLYQLFQGRLHSRCPLFFFFLLTLIVRGRLAGRKVGPSPKIHKEHGCQLCFGWFPLLYGAKKMSVSAPTDTPAKKKKEERSYFFFFFFPPSITMFHMYVLVVLAISCPSQWSVAANGQCFLAFIV